MMEKVLITTSWSPTHTKFFGEYSQGVSEQLKDGSFEKELMLGATFAETKFESLVGSMILAQAYALSRGFTHVFNVEADRVLPSGIVRTALNMSCPVVLIVGADRLRENGIDSSAPSEEWPSIIKQRIGWGVALVETAVLRRVPFENALVSQFLWPDILWLKRAKSAGVTVQYLVSEVKDMQVPSSTVSLSFSAGVKINEEGIQL
jgi:hypothetical protein